MKTFREYFEERYHFNSHSLSADYHRALGESFIDYVDEIVAPAAQRAANPLMVVDSKTLVIPETAGLSNAG